MDIDNIEDHHFSNLTPHLCVEQGACPLTYAVIELRTVNQDLKTRANSVREPFNVTRELWQPPRTMVTYIPNVDVPSSQSEPRRE